MKFVCANADLIQNINLDTDYDYITANSKSIIMAVETLANSFAKSKSDCVLFVWNTNDPSDLVRATEEACVENVNFKKIIDDLEKNLDYSILGDFDLESIELENGMTISVVKYVTMNNFVESKKSARKSIKESKNDIDFNNLNGFINFKEYGDNSRGGGAFSEIKKLFEKDSSFQNIVSLIKDLESDFELTKFTFSPNSEINISFKEVGGNFEFFVKYEIIRSGIGLTNLRYF